LAHGPFPPSWTPLYCSRSENKFCWSCERSPPPRPTFLFSFCYLFLKVCSFKSFDYLPLLLTLDNGLRRHSPTIHLDISFHSFCSPYFVSFIAVDSVFFSSACPPWLLMTRSHKLRPPAGYCHFPLFLFWIFIPLPRGIKVMQVSPSEFQGEEGFRFLVFF